MFHDRARIEVRGGRGGGDGGNGGDVVLVADPDRRDLSFFQRTRRFEGGRGIHGQGKNKHGADGETVELRVPVGTQVLDEEGGRLVDLAHPGARAVVARGGRGGAGNRRCARPT